VANQSNTQVEQSTCPKNAQSNQVLQGKLSH
jgi:hypothetical protein